MAILWERPVIRGRAYVEALRREWTNLDGSATPDGRPDVAAAAVRGNDYRPLFQALQAYAPEERRSFLQAVYGPLEPHGRRVAHLLARVTAIPWLQGEPDEERIATLWNLHRDALAAAVAAPAPITDYTSWSGAWMRVKERARIAAAYAGRTDAFHEAAAAAAAAVPQDGDLYDASRSVADAVAYETVRRLNVSEVSPDWTFLHNPFLPLLALYEAGAVVEEPRGTELLVRTARGRETISLTD